MAVTVTKDSGDTTFKFEVTGLSTKLDPILEKWAEYVYNHGFGTVLIESPEEGQDSTKVDFDDLTNQQKLDAINARLKKLAVDEADTQENDDVKAAKEAEKTVHDLQNID